MGYISSSNSDLKLFHHDSCRYTKIVSRKNAVRLRTSREARDQGYQYCKYCSSLMKMIQKEAAEINAFEKTHGIYLSFDRSDGTVDVISSVGRWKLVYNHKHMIRRAALWGHGIRLHLKQKSGTKKVLPRKDGLWMLP